MRHPTALPLVLALLACTLPVHAQYKVVAPDGSVTYTDRPVAPRPGAKVSTLGPGGAVTSRSDTPSAEQSSLSSLPTELRGLATRFPVTLFTGADCSPCDSARRLLQQRGIPYVERSITSEDDAAALQRLSNGRTVPTLTVGQQAQRGLLDTEWHKLLDLAGYPKESRLPRTWQAAPATPLVARVPVADQAPTAPTPARPAATAEPAADPSLPNIRF